ncbi:MAG: hypothetical protein P4L95_13095 [Rouxiella aceris]|uniref:hypothetical protein n=1 Tax=Rouxiella aceris TaxID=2703884 RepID=UPI00283D6527|nr:hypothetical protein [Rouxiella aceris]MDR3432817.1 hypothetical protein [Rouxiella aceris]
MSNVIKLNKGHINTVSCVAEATPDGINIMSLSKDGIYKHTKLVGYSAMIRQLDSGQFDNTLSEGFGVIAELSLGEQRGWFAPSDEQRVIVWRWMVAGVFIVEQMRANGTAAVSQSDGTIVQVVRYVGKHGGITVYPATERFSLASHIEGLAFEKYTLDNPHQKALMLYQSMVEESPDGGMKLSQWGREGLEMLHDGFIEMLNTEGMPAAPTAH